MQNDSRASRVRNRTSSVLISVTFLLISRLWRANYGRFGEPGRWPLTSPGAQARAKHIKACWPSARPLGHVLAGTL